MAQQRVVQTIDSKSLTMPQNLPEEIPEILAYLIGPHTDNMTGAVLNNDGGLSA